MDQNVKGIADLGLRKKDNKSIHKRTHANNAGRGKTQLLRKERMYGH